MQKKTQQRNKNQQNQPTNIFINSLQIHAPKKIFLSLSFPIRKSDVSKIRNVCVSLCEIRNALLFFSHFIHNINVFLQPIAKSYAKTDSL